MNKSTAFKQPLNPSKIWPLFLKMSAATLLRFGSLRSSKHFRRMSPQRKGPSLQSDNGKQIISWKVQNVGKNLWKAFETLLYIYLPPMPSKIREISRKQQVYASCFSDGSPNRLVPQIRPVYLLLSKKNDARDKLVKFRSGNTALHRSSAAVLQVMFCTKPFFSIFARRIRELAATSTLEEYGRIL